MFESFPIIYAVFCTRADSQLAISPIGAPPVWGNGRWLWRFPYCNRSISRWLTALLGAQRRTFICPRTSDPMMGRGRDGEISAAPVSFSRCLVFPRCASSGEFTKWAIARPIFILEPYVSQRDSLTSALLRVSRGLFTLLRYIGIWRCILSGWI